MCVPGLDPLTLALIAGGTAASVAGGNMNAQAQNDAIAAQNEQNRQAADANRIAVEQEQVRQRGLEDQQTAEVAEALTKANPAKALARVRREAPMNPVASPAGYNATPKAPVKNEHIERDAKRTGRKDDKRTDGILQALAMLTEMGSAFGEMGDAIDRSGSNISTIGGFRRGSMDANRLETSIPAATVTPSDSMMGDLLLLGGQLAGGLGGRRAGRGVKPPQAFTPRTFDDPTIQLQNLHGLY